MTKSIEAIKKDDTCRRIILALYESPENPQPFGGLVKRARCNSDLQAMLCLSELSEIGILESDWKEEKTRRCFRSVRRFGLTEQGRQVAKSLR